MKPPKACIVFNPAAGGERAQRCLSYVKALGSQWSVKFTTCAGDARRLAANAVREGCDVVVAAGGDGTLNEVLNGLGDVPDAFARTRLGVVPLGTVNVFAKEIGVPLSFERSLEILTRGRETTVDLPEAAFQRDGVTVRRYFAQMAGAGLDSKAIELVSWEQKRRFGPVAYMLAGLKALRMELPDVVVSTGTESASGKLILVGNGRFYGGRFSIFPLADLRDGLLDVSVFPKVSLEAIVRCGWGLFTDKLHQRGGVKHLKGSQITVSSAAPVWLELEGENVGHLPATLKVNRHALRIIVP